MFKQKSIFLIAAVLTSLVVVGSVSGVFYLKYLKETNETAQQIAEQTTQQTETTQDIVEQKQQEKGRLREEITEDDKSYNEAFRALEMAGHKVDPNIEKEVKDAFKVVIKECKTANILEIDYSIEKHLKMAKQDMIMAFAVSFQQNGYDVNVDDIEVYESSVSDVVQFIVKSTKKGEDSIFWAGNYNTMAHQVSIARYYGGHVGKAFG
ncbi:MULTISPECIES: hypothetical protein [Streptococcus]|mgnify:CR=1 FL=1|uniref:Uncharacterized protein n=1 Tax=Streptococcus mitis TaxID=28037 RepID=A0A150NR33_STRMT|nr:MULTISPECIES: hypothetical protein [Streptococcus]KYF35259.1 hypothetical protein SMIM3IV_00078 [Streptococcus mitis]KYF35790.1 hypothetical protein SMIM3I_00085 [Streptococcus mitis]MBT2165233.1 hypothetical protein [Streptococcus mitis]OFN95442.1 hypothetical protein HMPREF2701_03285 [Streptococcus sp. HMSC077D04]